jgi:endonuclease/exonuclease/phosphatase family metal-dependent hydrolase
MNHTQHPGLERARPFFLAAGLAALIACPLLSLTGCAGKQTASGVSQTEYVHITIDGDLSDWPEGTAAWSDEHYIYVRFSVLGEQVTLQASPRPVTLLIDADGSRTTGQVVPAYPLNELGVDLELQFSPPRADGTPGMGVRLYAVDAGGTRTQLSTRDYDIVFAPTYASTWYEVRICRTPDNRANLPEGGLIGPGFVAGMATMSDTSGRIIAYSDPFRIGTEGTCVDGKRRLDLPPPSKPEGAVRIVNWNVEMNAPLTNPEGFSRVFTALDGDVVLLQEWDKGDEEEMRTWFDLNVPGGPWYVRKAKGNLGEGGGVAVVSKFPLSPIVGDSLRAPAIARDGTEQMRPVRFVGAVAKTPLGDMIACSVHLKSRGSKDSVEDRRRMAEARAINTAVGAVAGATGAPIRIIGGDINLVGSRPPIDIMRAGLDVDGTDLLPAPTEVWGDAAYYTWRQEPTGFTPGRLDWVVYSDSTVRAASAFVFDTSRLGDHTLGSLNVKIDDCEISDHLPVVVDLLPMR